MSAASPLSWEGSPPPMMKLLRAHWEYLKSDRDAYWYPHWRDCAEMFMPRRARFQITNKQDKVRRNDRLINGHPREASRTFAGGLMGNITSPAREWFRLITGDANLYEIRNVRTWLNDVERRLRLLYGRSNFYNCIHAMYQDLGVFGTAAVLLEEDKKTGLRAYTWPVGSFVLAHDRRLQVDRAMHEQTMTIVQMIQAFGYDRVNRTVRDAYMKGNYFDERLVINAIHPNDERQYVDGEPADGPDGMAYRSVWWDAGGGDDEPPLRVAGYHRFPLLTPRWEITDESSAYATAWPAGDVVGASIALQKMERRKSQMVDKGTQPPTGIPAALLRKRYTLGAGELVGIPQAYQGNQIQALYQVPTGGYQALSVYTKEFEDQVDRAFYYHLFMALTNSVGDKKTATEVQAMVQERMVILGPAMERLEDEGLNQAVAIGIGILQRTGQLPPPPQELANQAIRVEYLSVLTQAQKMLGATSMERFVAFIGQAGQLQAQAAQAPVMDGIDFDDLRDRYAEVVGLPPTAIKDKNDVADVRQARAQQQQQAAIQQQGLAMAKGAKDMSTAQLSDPSMLSQLLQQLSPVAGGLAGQPALGGTS